QRKDEHAKDVTRRRNRQRREQFQPAGESVLEQQITKPTDRCQRQRENDRAGEETNSILIRRAAADGVRKQKHGRWKTNRRQQKRAYLATQAGELNTKYSGDIRDAVHEICAASSFSKDAPVNLK